MANIKQSCKCGYCDCTATDHAFNYEGNLIVHSVIECYIVERKVKQDVTIL